MSLWKWQEVQTVLWQDYVIRGDSLIEVEQIKSEANALKEVLLEVGDSL